MEPAVIYLASELDVFLSLSEDVSGLVFEKEVVYVGDFVKKDNNGEVKFSVTPTVLEHWKTTWDRMLSNGVEVPWPVEHTDNPEAKRASVIGSQVKLDSKGRLGLFAKTRFVNKEAAKLAHSADVSIFVTPDFTDGNGNTYYKPIRHVALTNYPVITGLDKFQAIAASFVKKESPMPSALLPLAQKLGVPSAETLSDVQLEEAIVNVVTAMKTEIEDLKKKDPNAPPPADAQGAPAPTGGQSTTPQGTLVPGSVTTTTKFNELPPAVAASFKAIKNENRAAKIDALVVGTNGEGHITRAVAEKLKTEYCSDVSLALSLVDTSSDKQFDALIGALKENRAVKYGERTGPQGVALSNPSILDPKSNPLVADAEARAAAAKV
jgi:hypothetical protein